MHTRAIFYHKWKVMKNLPEEIGIKNIPGPE
jgi:hypothetical protein